MACRLPASAPWQRSGGTLSRREHDVVRWDGPVVDGGLGLLGAWFGSLIGLAMSDVA